MVHFNFKIFENFLIKNPVNAHFMVSLGLFSINYNMLFLCECTVSTVITVPQRTLPELTLLPNLELNRIKIPFKHE